MMKSWKCFDASEESCTVAINVTKGYISSLKRVLFWSVWLSVIPCIILYFQYSSTFWVNHKVPVGADMFTYTSKLYSVKDTRITYRNETSTSVKDVSNGTLNESLPVTGIISSTRLPQMKENISKLSVNCSEMWVSSHVGGRLGNIMCEYAHLLTLHMDYGIQVGLLPAMHNILSKTFPNLSARLLPAECLENQIFPSRSLSNIDFLLKNKNMTEPTAIGGYPCNATVLWRYRTTWRREFTFNSKVTQKAQGVIRKIVDGWKAKRGWNRTRDDPVIVGVHVRRTDYIFYLRRTTGGSVLQPGYFHRAFQFFRERYKDVVFLVTSDDRNWCIQNLVNKRHQDVIITPAGSATDDLALLSLSSHLIMSLGTYGFWAGILSHGIVTYPSKVGVTSNYFMINNMQRIKSPNLISIPS